MSLASRRSFLRAGFLRAEVMRPYGAVAAELFDRRCDGCAKCAAACPQGIVVIDEDGRARADLTRGECTFCEACITACPTQALTPEGRADWTWIARISDGCLSRHGVTCRSCEDACEPGAIRFRLQTGGRASPQVAVSACTGCGACAAGCPAGAISFGRRAPQQGDLSA